MAVREQDLLVTEAIVYRFPTHALRVRRARARALARRRALAGVVVVAVAAALLLATGPRGVATAGGAREGRRAVTVAAGDTLWDVAERFAPAGSELRAYVVALEELNGLAGPIHPGMRLKLPR